MEGLTHAIVGDLAKAGERRFGGHGTEVGLDRERLQQLGGSHGFSKSEDAMRVIFRQKKIEPLPDVVAFEKAVGGEFASAGAVRARVGEKNGETSGEKKLCVSRHSDAVVGEAVQQNYRIAIAVMRLDCPGTHCCSVWCVDGDVFKIGIQLASDLSHGSAGFRSQGAASRMQGSIGHENPSGQAA